MNVTSSSGPPALGRGPVTRGGGPSGAAVSFADALLPRGVVVHEALDVSARVVLPPTGVNGDWFDSVPLDRGRVGLMVGDVVGSGVEAGAAMAQIRAALRLALSSHSDPARALQEADRYALTVPAARWARAAVAVVDPRRSTVCYATAGNPAPMFVAGRTRCWPLDSTEGGPIGSGTPGERTATTLPLERGDALLLYTDGLLGRHPQPSVQNVASALLEPAEGTGGVGSVPDTTADLLCRRALTALDGVPDDDTVVLAAEVRRVWQPSMALELPVRTESSRDAQQALLEWTGRLGLAEVDELALAQAVAEIVGNVVDHARRPTRAGDQPAVFAVRATLTGPGDVQVTVADRGRWDPSAMREGPEAHTGGLAVAAHFVDDVLVDSGPEGTRVVLYHHVERPVALLTARELTSDRSLSSPSRDDDFATRLEDGVLEIAGSLGHHQAGEVGAVVRMASFGVDQLVVDLNRVSVLTTASVRAIDARTQRAGDAPEIRLVADPDTPAGQVLTMMGVEHSPSH